MHLKKNPARNVINVKSNEVSIYKINMEHFTNTPVLF